MGQMQFIVPHPERLPPHAAEHAYIAGAEGVPWECRSTLVGNVLAIQRSTRESGLVHVLWQINETCTAVLSSGTLMERVKPYLLPLELARGLLTRLRNQSAAWETAGMQITAEYRTKLAEATSYFAESATGQQDHKAAAESAQKSIAAAYAALETLGREYVDQVLKLRTDGQHRIPMLLAARVDHAPPGPKVKPLAEAFNTMFVEPLWSELETNMGQRHWTGIDAAVRWTQEHDFRLGMGPLVNFDPRNLPDWITLWNDDFEELASCVTQFVRAVVQRYKGKVQLWHVAAGLNAPDSLDLSEDQRLRIAVDALETVRSIDSKTPLVISVAQPWAEYIARQDHEFSPFSFADTLVRGDLGISAIGLEINLGYSPQGTLPRDPLEFSRMIDRWTQLGLPLVVMLAAPSEGGDDAKAACPVKNVCGSGAAPTSVESQRALLEKLLPLLASKQPVQAVVWNQLADARPHAFPHAGLFDAAEHAKPLLKSIADVRRKYLN